MALPNFGKFTSIEILEGLTFGDTSNVRIMHMTMTTYEKSEVLSIVIHLRMYVKVWHTKLYSGIWFIQQSYR